MKANPIFFTDLDRLLTGAGFVFERPARSHTLSTHAPSGAPPHWQPGDRAHPVHAVSVRRTLVDWGILELDDVERWLCTVRFGTDCREPASVGDRDAATG